MNLKSLYVVIVTALALGISPLSARELTEGEWSLQLFLNAEAEGLEDSFNSLGQLSDALPDYDRNDLHELGQPFAGTYLSVIFHRPDWVPVLQTKLPDWATEQGVEEEAVEMDWEDFNTDYHPISYMGPTWGCNPQPGMETGDEWTFEVRSNDPARSLSLTWAGSEGADLERMVLIDLQENVTAPAVIGGVTQEYDFVMNGAVRAFAWRLLSDEEYEELTGGASAAAVALGATTRSAAFGTEADAVQNTPGSDWLPMGWSPNQFDHPIPNSLPADPLDN